VRTARTSSVTELLAALSAYQAEQRVTVRLSTATARTRRSIAELIQAHAFGAHCQVAVAESRGIAVRWVDGIVSGSVEQVSAFFATVTPVLDRSHGQVSFAV
jgi:hypothetical protein